MDVLSIFYLLYLNIRFMNIKPKVIFVGSQNLGGLQDDGETMKNYMLARELERHGCRVCRIDTRNRPKRVFYMIKYLYNLIAKRDSKIIMSASTFVAYKMLKVAYLLGWKGDSLYYWVIGGAFGTKIEENAIDKGVYLSLHKIIVEGASMKKQLDYCGFNNVMALPNFKDIDYIPLLKSKQRDGITRFVFLSRVMPEKGVDYIVEATKLLIKEGTTHFIVDLFGVIDQNYSVALNNAINDIEIINYKGFLKLDEGGYETLSSYDVMLFPTYWHGEGFPGIIIDAFVAGVPVIASDWNLNSTLIKDGEDGIIIPAHSPEALAKTMKDIIMRKVNLQEMSEKAQENCMNYDSKHVITKELLEELEIL